MKNILSPRQLLAAVESGISRSVCHCTFANSNHQFFIVLPCLIRKVLLFTLIHQVVSPQKNADGQSHGVLTYDPHSSVLDKIIFLKITTKFIYNISKILNNQMKITTPSIIFKKKIPKIFSIIMRNEGWKLKKEWKIQATLSPFIPHPPLNLAMHHKNA